jgi:hypothetical protein
LNIVIVGFTQGVRGWDRSDLLNNIMLWDYTASGHIRGVASKVATTWFITGRGAAAEVFRFRFEIANTIQLTFVTNNADIHACTWYINTAYIISASTIGSSC